MKREAHNRKVETRDELLTRILVAAVCIKKCEDQLRLTTRDLRTRVAKYSEVDGGFFEHLFLNCDKIWHLFVINLTFKQ